MRTDDRIALSASALTTVDEERTTPDSPLCVWTGRLSFNGKMRILLLCITLLTLVGNTLTARLVYDEICTAIEGGLINQVQGEARRLEALHLQDPKTFIARAAHSLATLRWGEHDSGYFFITDRDATLLVYPPDPARIGKRLDDVPLEESHESLNQALIRIAGSGKAALITYSYIKPSSQTPTLKTAYVHPLGDYLLVSGVYLDSADAVFYNYLRHSSVILLATLAILLGLITFFSRTFSSHVTLVLKGLQDMAGKILTTRLLSRGNDEIAFIINAMDDTRQQLSDLLHHQRAQAGEVTLASGQINRGMGEVNDAICEQRLRLDNLASAMEQMIASIREVTQSAQASADSAHRMDQWASGGAGKIQDAITAINHLFDNLHDSAHAVGEVADKVSLIGTIIDTINGISEQTNLLALNAAIEAARAGEQGRGFSVVADEVRTLAKRTKEATYEISGMIVALQGSTRQSVGLMQESIQAASRAKEDATGATECFEAIAGNTGQLSTHCQMIAAATEEQTAVTGDTLNSLQVIRNLVQETEQVARALGDTSQQMRGSAEQMSELVGSYRLG
ncbi:methyl-accepting chemotaxis protein [Aeromonas rivipollensis]|uniref:methyl-accepting chemotaxis protein n=1 Tax=Aeromonas rivipollensis TaxID=948519 RepID=UPI0038D14240